MDYIAGENELNEEIKEQLKSISNVRGYTEKEKKKYGKAYKQTVAAFIILFTVFIFPLAKGVLYWISDGIMTSFLVFLFWYIMCNLGVVILSFCTHKALGKNKRIFVTKGYIKRIIPYYGLTLGIIYYDFENNAFRTAIYQGELLDKEKYNFSEGMLIDILVAEKGNGIRFLCIPSQNIPKRNVNENNAGKKELEFVKPAFEVQGQDGRSLTVNGQLESDGMFDMEKPFVIHEKPLNPTEKFWKTCDKALPILVAVSFGVTAWFHPSDEAYLDKVSVGIVAVGVFLVYAALYDMPPVK